MLRPWKLEVEINRASTISIHVQIAQTIIAEIQQGRLTTNMALPGTRELANRLGVNRKTVVQAYEELIAQGWLTSESKRGTFVSSRILLVNANRKPTKQLNYDIEGEAFAEPISHNNKKLEHEIINFSSGLSDARLIPIEVLSRAMRHALIATARTNKQSYLEPRGALILREAILQMLNIDRGLHAGIDNICVVRGTQMGIFLAARVIVKQGDNVVIASLCDQLVNHVFKSCGASMRYIAQNEYGLDLNALETLCQKNKIRAVYVTPHYQVPTTVSMPMSHRRRLIAMAEQYDFLIIEDDHDFEFNFSSKPILPIASIDKSSRVIYIGSLSKVLAPGFRLGFIAAAKDITKHIASEIMVIDRQGNTVTELAIAELLHTGEINRHTSKVLKIYEARRTLMMKLIKIELKDYIDFKTPSGGLTLWLNVNHNINMHTFIKDAEFEKVRIVDGRDFSQDENNISAICLGFANLNNDEMILGVKRLKRAFTKQTLIKNL